LIVKLYNPEDAIKLCGDESKRPQANLNQSAGPAYSFYEDKKLICCGGVRIYGVGEAWLLTTDENRRNHAKTIMRVSKEQLDKVIRENSLWRLWAETKVSENFLEHLGFEPMKAFVR
jgi:hypothetical protein